MFATLVSNHWIGAAAVTVMLMASAVTTPTKAAESDFSSKTIDIGVVVSDIEKALTFYKDVIGFTEISGFKVPGDYAGEVGLSDGHELEVHVLVLGEGEGATRLKLMQFKGVESKKSDNRNIHAQLGFSYLTVRVNDTATVMKRVKAAGIKTLGKSPMALPDNFPAGIYLTLVPDPDGNIVELVGPSSD